MRLDLNLKHHRPGESLSFTWDSDSGVLVGPDAARARRLIDHAGGKATFPTWPEMEAPDPLHTPRSMALIFASYGYDLPPELAAELPEFSDDLPADVIA